ncbi:efflux RND transporter permease subunit [Flavobacterium sp. NRK F10]|uniref:Hydrophobe/amphiphile efflux-1 family RND transporter n=1 Tax=Flavobacterium sediminis TaxID=2201181 RepID=A0A2U8QTK3_9FLAO|nr:MULTISPECIES: efflux RND transporter permease subunit [Flavobacterium]AWM13502.1 hydrophobe/amphiphile efflux-1 family RND transporter [Flavobacterium sediminis]MCO6174614.1 efflux RND transporter permease subunit [Flavobacterium sp. NRK F10]
MLRKFIDRPVLSTVISIIIVILGILGLITLPVSQYPEIAPPTVTVSASYQGASAEVVMNSVVIPLEEQINGVEDMTYMTSTSSNDGSATINIYFKLGTNPDMAAVNVQNRVSRATPLLPQEVTRAGVTTAKRQSDNILIFGLYSANETYDMTFLQNYANINIIPKLKRVTGVGEAMVFGQKDYSMRIWLKPDVMASHSLVPADVMNLLSEQNIEAAPGQFGEDSDQSFQYTLKYKGRLQSIKEFEQIVVKSTENGEVLRLGDIARVELGAQNYASNTLINGHQAVAVAIAQTAGSNAQEVIEGCLKVLEQSEVSFPKGVEYASLVNANDFLEESISKVLHTLIEAFILVFIVVFVFLQDWRSTLIPAISVPVAIVGTFFFLNLFGFTINMLTLFALVLAVGIVVDDAIVVVEAVHAKMEAGEHNPKKAAHSAMDEISGAIISITLVMSAVFIPVSFISGSAGVFYKQFGLTLAVSIVLSAINALTLSPALCAIFLKPHDEHENSKKGLLKRFYTAFNVAFDSTTSKYKRSVEFFLNRKWLAFFGIIVFAGIFVFLMNITPKSFVPNEDTGTIMSDVSLPPSTSLERTEAVLLQIENAVKDIPEIERVLRISGRSLISGTGSNYGMIIVNLKPWAERKEVNQEINAVVGELFKRTATIKDARVIFFARPTLTGFGFSSGFEFQLQDQKGGTIQELNTIKDKFLGALNSRPEIKYATTSFSPNYPQYQIDLNVPAIKKSGLTVSDVLGTMQGYYGGVYASNFNKFGKQYRVMYQAEPEYRSDPESLNKVMVRTASGVMAPISQFIDLKKVFGPQVINRFNLFTSVNINGAPADGFSSGDAINAIEEVAQQTLPIGYGYEYSGMTREEINAGGQTVFIFLLCLIFVYFLLSAQYESYMLPFAVLLSLPVGLAGAFIFAYLFNVSNNIYLQITLIMLIGLLAKNAILIVEFAADARRKGMSISQAAVQGAVARLRPILMTSFAFILGLVPLMLAQGAGAVGNQSIGTGAIGGMLIGTIFGVLIIPVLFVVFQSLQEKVSSKNA